MAPSLATAAPGPGLPTFDAPRIHAAQPRGAWRGHRSVHQKPQIGPRWAAEVERLGVEVG